MHHGRMNTAFENDSFAESSDSDSESLGSLVNPTSISALLEDLENQAGAGKNGKTRSSKSDQQNQYSDNSFPSSAENYDDLIRKELIRPWPGENVVSGEPTGDLSGGLVRNLSQRRANNLSIIEELENTHGTNSNTDILISELKEQLEDEEFLNSELAKKKNSLEEEIKRLKLHLEDEKSLKNNIQLQLEEMQNERDTIAIRLKDEQETLDETVKKLHEEEEASREHQIEKKELTRELEESRKSLARLQDQLQQLQEDKATNNKQLEHLEVTNQALETLIQDLREQLQDSNAARADLEEKRGQYEETFTTISKNGVRIKTQYEQTLFQLQQSEDQCKKLKAELKLSEDNHRKREGENGRLQMQIDDLQNDQQKRCKRCCCLIS